MRVIIATDGSEFSTAAVERYRDTLARDGDVVRILSVVEPMTHVVGAPFGVVDSYYNSYLTEAKSQAAAHADEAGELFADRTSIEVTTEVIIGSPARSIVEAASEWGADLIVLGSHGRGFWKRVYLGSVSASVVHQAPCSVLIVRRA